MKGAGPEQAVKARILQMDDNSTPHVNEESGDGSIIMLAIVI